MSSEGDKLEYIASFWTVLLRGAPDDHPIASIASRTLLDYQSTKEGSAQREERARELFILYAFFVQWPDLQELWVELGKPGQKRAMEAFGSILVYADNDRRVQRRVLVADLTRPRKGEKRAVMGMVELNRTLEHLESKKFITRSKGEDGRVWYQYADISLVDTMCKCPWLVKDLMEDSRRLVELSKKTLWKGEAAESLAKEYGALLRIPPEQVEKEIDRRASAMSDQNDS
jgi:hypothetical protein